MQARVLAIFAVSLLLAACASPEGNYPSLAIRDAERWTGAIEVESYVPPAPAPTTINRVEDLAVAARAAHGEFLAALPQARNRVSGARGAGVGSERWSVAQVAVADLETHRSQVMIALADLDRIYVATSTEGQDIAPFRDVRGEIAALVEQENAVIAELLGMLR